MTIKEQDTVLAYFLLLETGAQQLLLNLSKVIQEIEAGTWFRIPKGQLGTPLARYTRSLAALTSSVEIITPYGGLHSSFRWLESGIDEATYIDVCFSKQGVEALHAVTHLEDIVG